VREATVVVTVGTEELVVLISSFSITTKRGY
jgi:hypothetical protein